MSAQAQTPTQELREYLGASVAPAPTIIADWNAAPRQTPEQVEEFYRSTKSYLYDLTAWHESFRYPYPEIVGSFARRYRLKHILEFGCGVGTDGIRLAEQGFTVSFYDFRNASTEFLAWRLKRRGWDARIYYAGEDELPENDLTFAMDVLEHLVNPVEQAAAIARRTRAFAYNLPLFPQLEKYPMHFEVDRKAMNRMMRRHGFRPVFHFAPLRHPRALALFWEGPAFWVRRDLGQIPNPKSQMLR